MAKVQNTFLKSKMNKDLDARLLPEGEYRDARNVQVSKSESDQVGNLENSLGNEAIADYTDLTGQTDIVCIGNFADELNNTVYLFFTNYLDENPNVNNGGGEYEPTASNFIISTNILTNESTILVRGAFLNFSQTNLITGVNILENLLFFTDNRNQPRVINTTLANPDPRNTNPTHYTIEDQISVAKYNPFEAIELYERSGARGTTTMKDVSSLFLPNGGAATCIINSVPLSNEIHVDNVIGEINIGSGNAYGQASRVFVQDNLPGGDFTLTDTGETVVGPIAGGSGTSLTIKLTGDVALSVGQKVVFNANPYFDPTFAGDPDYLEDKFVRFAYRYRFEDNTYSIFSPFTQIAFIPKQDGYFMFVDPNNGTNTGSQAKNDQDEAYRSTIVYFMENKVNSIDLKIPLPFNNYDIQDALKIKEIDILYKESDGIAVRVVETLPVNKITNQSCVCEVDGAQTPGAAGNPIAIKNIQGGITIGRGAFGPGISGSVTSFTPTDPSNPVSGTITVSSTVAQLDDNSPIIIGDIKNFNYEYKSTKPTKTLPESNLIRVYDKIPVRAQAQEVSGNRVIYGNFQNKITPPDFLNYNVASTEKDDFNTGDAAFTYTAGAATYAAGDPISVTIIKADSGGMWTGYYVTCSDYGVNIPVDTQVTSATSNITGASTITLSNTVTFPGGTVNVIAEPGASTEDSVTKVEYPNSSVKTNRNYQVGFVLSDRYGRQSSVILSNNETSIIVNGIEYAGSTLFSPYIDRNVDQTSWPGNSLKVLMNEPIPNNNLYNGDVTSVDYNPLGWYSYKIVVKQTEQDYYNVYLPGIMASYPNDATLEIGQTSHAVLINDNINKVPRDLTEVGPDQKQFRSSVQLIGRVQNTAPLSIVSGNTNSQYYPQRTTDTVSVISTVNDLFDFNPIEPPLLNLFPQFYSLESNPLIARLSTEFKIGQLPNANYLPAGGESVLNSGGPPPTPSSTLTITSVSGDPNILNGTILLDDYLVSGVGIPAETYVSNNTPVGGGGALPGEMNIVLKDSNGLAVVVNLAANTKISLTPTEGNASVPNFKLTRPGIQYLAVCETQPVESAIDIFWETSTSGLISDLNQAVLNNQSQPAGSDISWNPDFNEGLAEDGFILAAPFIVQDNFGQTIALSAGDTLELAAANGGPPITNGLGESVSGPGFVSTTQVRDYFRLVDTSGTGVGPWQIQTTSASDPTADNYVPSASNYFDNVYYFYNSQAELRQFTFNFRIVIDGQESFVTKVANLGNVVPEFFTIEALNVNTLPITYGPGVGTPIPTLVPVQSNKSTRDISIININNGSSSFTDPNPNGGRALSTRDLRIVDQNDNDFGIWSQNIGSPNGPPAEVITFEGTTAEDRVPIFSLQAITPITSNGNIQVKLINLVTVLGAGALSLMSSSVYYITLALQDAGGTIVFQQIEVDMRVQLSNNNFWNKIQTVDAYGYSAENYSESGPGSPPQFIAPGSGAPSLVPGEPGGCGAANFCQPPGGRTKWWCYPSTLFEINENDIGASADTYGWYLFALGYFDNTPGDSGLCCDTDTSFGIAGSTSLVEYSSADITNSITIPMNTPILPGQHLVQRQPTFLNKRGFSSATITQINSWGYPPLLHGRIAVTGYEILASGEEAWTYEVLDGDPDKAITGCMKLFRDFGGSYDFNTGVSTYGFGWNCGGANGIHFQNSQATQEQIVLDGTPNVRTARISSTFVDSLGDKKFTYSPRGTSATAFGFSRDEPNTGGQADLDRNWDFTQGPQIIYTYAGPQNFQTSPWFFVPTNGTTTTMDPIKKIWSMYTYSGWVGCKWRSNKKIRGSAGFRDRKYWEIWAQRWKPDVPFVNPPETIDAVDEEEGIQRNLNDENPPCEAHAQHLAQDSRPLNAGNYQYAII